MKEDTMNEPITSQNQAITDETLLALFRRAAHFMARAHHHQGHAHHAQKHVLALLKEKGPLNQRDLLDLLGIRSASLSELLAKLERGGLITREKDEQDRRNYVISISEEGNAAVTDHEAEQRAGAEAIFAPLTGEERQQMGELLIKVIVALEDAFPAHRGCRGHHGHEMHGECRRGHGFGHGHSPDREGPGHHGRHGRRHAHSDEDRDTFGRGPHRRGHGPEEDLPE